MKHTCIRRFAVLSGVRRVGKTIITYQLIDHLIEGTRYTFFDEIQYTDNWELSENLRLSELIQMEQAELGDLMRSFMSLQNHFNRYLMVGGFSELVLSDDNIYAQRMLREDVVDKVIKRDAYLAKLIDV